MATCRPALYRPSLAAVTALLAEADLPAEDLSEAHMAHFLAAGNPAAPDGVVGVEPLPGCGLLRSLAVRPACRGARLGATLLAAAEDHARALGLSRLYLLTDTATGFFGARGYHAVQRDDAPAAIRDCAQFSRLCPASAVLLARRL